MRGGPLGWGGRPGWGDRGVQPPGGSGGRCGAGQGLAAGVEENGAWSTRQGEPGAGAAGETPWALHNPLPMGLAARVGHTQESSQRGEPQPRG